MLVANGVGELLGRGEWEFPKLDVAGSNPVARSRRKRLAERNFSVPAGGRQCGPEVKTEG
jgi:hypothetical protein